MNLTAQTCFLSPAFTHWWDAVHQRSDGRIWDDGILLDLMVEAFNEGKTPEQAIEIGFEAECELAWEDKGRNPFS